MRTGRAKAPRPARWSREAAAFVWALLLIVAIVAALLWFNSSEL
jgi:hypothetical protein